MNTTTGGGEQGPKYDPCSHCNLFHKEDPSGKFCLVDKKGKPRIESMVGHRSTTEVKPDGRKSLSEYWRKKYLQFFFPKIGYSPVEAEKTIKELRAAIAKLADASCAEVVTFAKNQVLFTELAEQEDRTNIKALIREKNVIVSYVQGLRSGTGSKAGKEKSAGSKKTKKRRPQVEEVGSSESDEEGSEWDSDQS